jgi:hypothetical protein
VLTVLTVVNYAASAAVVKIEIVRFPACPARLNAIWMPTALRKA